MTHPETKRDLEMAATGWNEAVKALCPKDGTPVIITNITNPYEIVLRTLERENRE